MPCSYKKTESTSGDDADKHLQLSSIIWLSVGADKHYILITVCRCRQCPAPTRRPSPHQVLVLTNTCRDEPDFQLSEGTDSTMWLLLPSKNWLLMSAVSFLTVATSWLPFVDYRLGYPTHIKNLPRRAHFRLLYFIISIIRTWIHNSISSWIVRILLQAAESPLRSLMERCSWCSVHAALMKQEAVKKLE